MINLDFCLYNLLYNNSGNYVYMVIDLQKCEFSHEEQEKD